MPNVIHDYIVELVTRQDWLSRYFIRLCYHVEQVIKVHTMNTSENNKLDSITISHMMTTTNVLLYELLTTKITKQHVCILQ